jgi:rhamnose transport system substrate-binding protein
MTFCTSRTLRMLLAVLALSVLALTAGACGETKDDEDDGGNSGGAAVQEGKADPSAEIEQGLEIVSMPKQLGNPYEEIEHGGVKKAVEEAGGEHRIEGPTDAGASSQVPLINTIAQQKPDGLIIAGNDPNAVVPALQNAAKRGVAIVGMDSDVAPDARPVFINQASSEDIGRDQIKIASEQIGGKGQIAILSATANATNQNTWIKFMKDELKKPEYKDIELVKVAYGDDDDQKSFQETQGLLQAYPNLKAIIAPTTVGIAAAARYICGSRYEGKVKVTGLGTPNQMRKFVKSGCVDEFALWNPEDVGYLAGWASLSLVSGRITGAEGETFEAGKLGERTIGKNGEVILGPPTRFNKENIDDFDF